MSHNDPIIRNAGEREAGALCAKCSAEISLSIPVAVCTSCGAVHHENCWQEGHGCSAYECTEGKATIASSAKKPLTITREELQSTEPLPTPKSFNSLEAEDARKVDRRWNRASIWAMVVALLGIPLFGIITGLIAILIGCIALVIHRENRRGMGLAVAAMVLGLLDVVGWSIGLSSYFGTPRAAVSMSELAIDASSLDDLPEYIARAMRANVLIQIDAGFGRGGIGSGVVLKVNNGQAYIVTNRHVIDQNYSDSTTSAPKNLSDLASVMVMSISQVSIPGAVEWVAPHGIDLAIVSAPLSNRDVQEANWDNNEKAKIGDEVFAVGNPHGLGWTHTSGSLSQIRSQRRGNMKFKILQTSAPINPGNSGGGLYDSQGHLVGINSMTAEKRIAEGLGFAIDFSTLVDLIPERFDITSQNIVTDQEAEESD